MDVLTRLRAATDDAHRRIETRLQIFPRLATAAGRLDLLMRFWGLHAGAEQVLAAPLAGVEGLAYEDRRRTARLREDLSALGACPSQVPLCPVASIGSVTQALGFLYVLEGSTLGGRIIRRQVEAQGREMTGLSFLDPYGHRTGAFWHAFLAVLRREATSPEAVEDVARGGVLGFAHAEGWLCPAH